MVRQRHAVYFRAAAKRDSRHGSRRLQSSSIMYQILAYYGTTNLGDAIQSVALSCFLEQPVRGVYRHELPYADPLCPLVINGWIGDSCGRATVLPEREDVYFLGIHADSYHFRWYDYWRIIGARDKWTERRLWDWNASSICVGCASAVAFPTYAGPRRGFYCVDCDGDGTALSHSIPLNMPWADQWALALHHLDIYRTAKHVLTRRLHVVLPCLAFGTPVSIPTSFPIDRRFSVLDHYQLQPDSGPLLFRDKERHIEAFVSFGLSLGLNMGRLGQPKYPDVR